MIVHPRSGDCGLVLLAALLSAASGVCQTRDDAASRLIYALTYQSSDQPDKGAVLRLGCGPVKEDRATARSLADMGVSAIPAIEEAIDSVERQADESRFSFNSGWLVLAYARIKGPAALPLVRRMIGNPKLDFLQVALDQSAALSLDLTSYVSRVREPLPTLRCSRGGEPRDALDQLILGWERNDRGWLEASLGPAARGALGSLLAGRTWSVMRAALWRGKSDGVAVGYRFDTPGRWAEPDETLEQERVYENIALSPGGPALETRFKDSSGADCGKSLVKFANAPITRGSGYPSYLVDNSNLGDLLALIGQCAEQ
jgi:hypothetical protein